MPRFSPQATSILKSALRERAENGHRLSDAQVAALAVTTELTEAQIRAWNYQAHENHPTSGSIQAFLVDNPKVISVEQTATVHPFHVESLWFDTQENQIARYCCVYNSDCILIIGRAIRWKMCRCSCSL